jgi:8-oxo-dGTP diphosphatase
MSPSYKFPRPAVTVDTVVFDLYDDVCHGVPHVLLIRRKNEPFKGMWAIPGGFLEVEEELEDGAARELYEETGVDIDPGDLRQAFTVGRINRDPRDRIISVVYTAVVDRFEHVLCANDDAEDAAWFGMGDLPELAADHLEIIRKTLGEIYHDRT